MTTWKSLAWVRILLLLGMDQVYRLRQPTIIVCYHTWSALQYKVWLLKSLLNGVMSTWKSLVWTRILLLENVLLYRLAQPTAVACYHTWSAIHYKVWLLKSLLNGVMSTWTRIFLHLTKDICSELILPELACV